MSAGPRAPNSWIAREDSSVCFDNLQDFSSILHNVRDQCGRPPAWLFKDDVSGTYRQWPVNSLWQIKQVVTIDGQRHIDRCMEFGTCSAARIWCLFMGLITWITIYVKGIDDLLHYTDDAFSHDVDLSLYLYEPYNELYPAKQVSLLLL